MAHLAEKNVMLRDIVNIGLQSLFSYAFAVINAVYSIHFYYMAAQSQGVCYPVLNQQLKPKCFVKNIFVLSSCTCRRHFTPFHDFCVYAIVLSASWDLDSKPIFIDRVSY